MGVKDKYKMNTNVISSVPGVGVEEDGRLKIVKVLRIETCVVLGSLSGPGFSADEATRGKLSPGHGW
jgi:hypothetical protein